MVGIFEKMKPKRVSEKGNVCTQKSLLVIFKGGQKLSKTAKGEF